ncbi:MAG: phosphoribosyl-ATP diphosphatase [Christensenellaceae bacterium]|nr:phosphoribosyl-ATP diphosphatase [Christensenellaceae bacterium]
MANTDSKVFDDLFKTINERKGEKIEGSYTCYLFEQGIDKILKKVGEEAAETIIAAKNGEKDKIVLESCDLIYHLLVMLAEREVPLADVYNELYIREQKQSNLKVFKKTDKNT